MVGSGGSRVLTNDQILQKLKKAFPSPKFGVQSWDYGQQVGVRRIGPSGRERSVSLVHLRNPVNLDSHIAELRAVL
jgi:hypothetical protein